MDPHQMDFGYSQPGCQFFFSSVSINKWIDNVSDPSTVMFTKTNLIHPLNNIWAIDFFLISAIMTKQKQYWKKSQL